MASSDTLIAHYMANTAPGPMFMEVDTMLRVEDPIARLIAFYLPQFHAIEQNDRWWGAGFTEWTNATKALPRFSGHYQPRLPADLGFYDLSCADTLRKQAALARHYGVYGFCFHHYWFAGTRLLERPLDNLLANPDIDLPFCVNWANENWSRRWDGLDQDILIGQRHSPEDDIAFARSLEPIFADPRYIRVGDRPLLMIYRPSILPDAAATVDRWRTHFAACGERDPFIVMVQAFGDLDPRLYNIDGAVGFPPHRVMEDIEQVAPDTWFDNGYRGSVYRYADLAGAAMRHSPSGYNYFPGVCPQWDNEARKPGRSLVFTGSTPDLYARWLSDACQKVADKPAEQQLVFINAWNEWAEGAYLEPDRHFGHAYLAATAQVISGNFMKEDFGDKTDVSSAQHQRSDNRLVRLKRLANNKVASAIEKFAHAIRGL